ncbi:flavin reductase family protein [Hyphomonas neptunium ATCC 15444]|uniref:Flavin reductase family protein n=1 Tax=Hyphomonas neptunium (strain ATCC 15444) TaxID=228405 RepID=Q0C180_HYPNA|nr:flavin reductase family protein [Hyphomonas neptunium ATCC 15444]
MAQFRGVGGLALQGQFAGNPDDPAVVLLEHSGQGSGFWDDLATVLIKAGRQVIRLAPFDVSASIIARDANTYTRESLRAVLSQLPMRPVILAAADDAPAAAGAIGHDATLLATGLVLIDPSIPDTETLDHIPDSLPALIIGGVLGESSRRIERIAQSIPGAEAVEIGGNDSLSEVECFDAFSAVLIDFLERRLPRATPEYRLGSDARTLRDALGCFATGVTIMTASDASGQPVGLTANSFTSVSLDPPLLLACIAKTAASSEVFREAETFAVNVLHIGQQPTSIRFSRRDEDRFGATPWEPGLNGTPVLTGSLATFECARHAVHDGGDHIILIGQVERARFEPRRDPLLYFRGKYRRLHFS